MKKYMIEREIPKVGTLEGEQLRQAAAKSNQVLRQLGPDIQWSESFSAGRSHNRLRTVLVTGEIALALFLLIGAGLLIRGIFLIEHQNLGFQADHLLTADVTLDRARYDIRMRPSEPRLSGISFPVSSTFRARTPSPLHPTCRQPDRAPSLSESRCSPNCLPTNGSAHATLW
jgi:hypothetical protein